MANLKSIENEIIHFLVSNILSEGVEVSEQTSLKDLGIDSFAIVEIILFIERKYGYVIPDEYLLPENFQTIHSIAQVVFEIEHQ